jgi:hypothetical protein
MNKKNNCNILLQGKRGYKGDDGAKGEPGKKGNKGFNGSDGPVGPTGPTGMTNTFIKDKFIVDDGETLDIGDLVTLSNSCDVNGMAKIHKVKTERWEWNASVDGMNREDFSSIAVDNCGNLYVSGTIFQLSKYYAE